MARTIELYESSTTTLTVYLAGLDTSYTNNNRTLAWYVTGPGVGDESTPVKMSSAPLPGGVYESSVVTFRNLKPGSSYHIMSEVTGTGAGWEGVSIIDDAVYSTDDATATLAPWSWEHANVATHSGATTQASDAQTRAAHTAITTKGPLSNFSWLVWNDLVNYFVEVMWAAGGTWSDSYAWYDNTKMTSGDRRMTAARFNSLRYNIDLLYSTNIPPVSKGDKIYGWYFTRLADCINGIISSL